MNTYALINSGTVEAILIAEPFYIGYITEPYDSIQDVSSLDVWATDQYSGDLYVGRANNYETLEVAESAPIDLLCRANGANLTYQWKKDTLDVVGETSSTMNIVSAVSGDAAAYTCEVSDGIDTIESSECVVTVA